MPILPKYSLSNVQWHPNVSCQEYSHRSLTDGQIDDLGIPFDNEMIKCCPMCAVPIEKDEGCAQMMCKRCKHVFCWYCLASLDVSFPNIYISIFQKIVISFSEFLHSFFYFKYTFHTFCYRSGRAIRRRQFFLFMAISFRMKLIFIDSLL